MSAAGRRAVEAAAKVPDAENGGPAAALVLQVPSGAARRGSTASGSAGPGRSAWSGSSGSWRSTRRSRSRPTSARVSDKGVQMFNQEAMYGIKAQLQVGEGAEFEALAEYPAGHGPARDRLEAIGPPHQAGRQGISHRAQQQYRHGARCRAGDVRAGAGLPRVDRAVSAALLTAFVALKDGDRVGAVRLRFEAARVEPADRRARAPSRAAAGRGGDRLFGERDQLHARRWRRWRAN